MTKTIKNNPFWVRGDEEGWNLFVENSFKLSVFHLRYALCVARYALRQLMRFAQWFWKTESFTAFKDELITCGQVYAMTG